MEVRQTTPFRQKQPMTDKRMGAAKERRRPKNPLTLVCLGCREHVEKARADMRRFKEQADRDLRDALVGYAVMQIGMCKKVALKTKKKRRRASAPGF